MTDDRARAERFAELFRAVYLTFHRRDGHRSQLAGASRAVLEHLALAGPLTVGEAAAHLSRAQSVVSEIVSHLERQGLLERESDPADRRRTLIWLTPGGHEALRRDREVLSVDLLARTLSRLPAAQADDCRRTSCCAELGTDWRAEVGGQLWPVPKSCSPSSWPSRKVKRAMSVRSSARS